MGFDATKSDQACPDRTKIGAPGRLGTLSRNLTARAEFTAISSSFARN